LAIWRWQGSFGVKTRRGEIGSASGLSKNFSRKRTLVRSPPSRRLEALLRFCYRMELELFLEEILPA